jgi:hypothetical protein
MMFDVVTGRALFKYEPYPKYKFDEPNYLLYQMICCAKQPTFKAFLDFFLTQLVRICLRLWSLHPTA